MSDLPPLLPPAPAPVDWGPADPTTSFYGQPTPTSPFIAKYQSNVRTLGNKYRSPSTFSPEFATELARTRARNPNAIDALRKLDTAKVLRGAKPYNAGESRVGLRAATENVEQTKPPEQSFWGNLTSDFQALVSSIPKIPELLRKEGRDAASILSDGFDMPAASSPGEHIGNIANLPIVRMVPGSFIAGSFAPGAGGVSDLIEHPLFTALDVLPYAETGARASKTVKLADALKAPLEEHLASASNYHLPQRDRPIRTLARNWRPSGPQTRPARNPFTGEELIDIPDTSGIPKPHIAGTIDPDTLPRTTIEELAPNPVGQAMDNLAQKLRRTRLGQLRADAFSPRARYGAQIHQEITYDMIQRPLIDVQEGRVSLDDGGEFGAIERVRLAAEEAKLSGDQPYRMYTIVSEAPNPVAARAAVEAELGSKAAVYLDELLTAQQQLTETKVRLGDLVEVEFDFRDPENPSAPPQTRVELLTPDNAKPVFDARIRASIADDLAARRTALDDVWNLDDTAATDRAAQLARDLSDVFHGILPTSTTTPRVPFDVFTKFSMSKTHRLAVIRAAIAELSALGYDMSPLVDALAGGGTRVNGKLVRGKPLNSKKMLESWARQNLTDNTGMPVPYALPQRRPALGVIESTIDALNRTADPKAAILRSQLSGGDISGAYRTIRDLAARKKFGYDIDFDALKNELRTWGKVVKSASTLDGFPSTKKAAKALDRAESAAMPGRYAELLRAEADKKFLDDILNDKITGLDNLSSDQKSRIQDIMAREAIGELDDIDIDAMARHRLDDPDTLPPFEKSGIVAIYEGYVKDARNGWRQYVEATGNDPVYVHRISQRDARKAFNPRFVDKVPGMVSLKDKLTNAERFPAVRNLAISITHDAYEMVLRTAAKAFLDQLDVVFGRDMPDVVREFAPEAQRRSLASGRPYNEVLQDLIQAEYVEWKPNAYTTGRSELPVAYTHDKRMIPREVKYNIDRLIADPGIFDRLLGKPMTIFRTAVLPLSPRWHLNNIISGNILLGATIGPEGMLANLSRVPEAWARARGRAGSARVAGSPAEGVLAAQGRWGVETAHGLMKAPLGERLSVMQQMYAGRAAGKLLNSVANTLGDRGISWIEKTVDAGSGAIRYSYKINALFDDFFRAYAQMAGETAALKKGMTPEAAMREGIKAHRSVAQDWDRMTPIERSIIRNVFPFYSWTAHVLKFVSRYPADHPWRLSVTSRLAETEWNDHLSGVPLQLRNLLFFGDVKDGKVTGLSVSGFNPFRDVANYPALVGFVAGQPGGNLDAIGGQLNPFIQLAVRGMGVDPVFGPELYPELEYDPTTGGVRVAQPTNFPTQFAAAFVPQSRFLTDILGWNEDFRELVASNPDAASRRLQSSLGLPLLTRTVDMDAEQIRSEINRFRQMQDEKARALKSGRIDDLNRWPGLRRMHETIASKTAAERQRHTPNARNLSLLDLLTPAVPTKTLN